MFYVFGLMWCPSIAAIFTSLVFQKSLRHIGWRWGKTKYQLLSFLLPIVYAFVTYSIVWLVGWGRINKDFSVETAEFLTVGILFSLLFALGEEIGWRGYLVPQLSKVTNFKSVCLISGLIWSVWHYPLIIFSGYHGGTPVMFHYPGHRDKLCLCLAQVDFRKCLDGDVSACHAQSFCPEFFRSHDWRYWNNPLYHRRIRGSTSFGRSCGGFYLLETAPPTKPSPLTHNFPYLEALVKCVVSAYNKRGTSA